MAATPRPSHRFAQYLSSLGMHSIVLLIPLSLAMKGDDSLSSISLADDDDVVTVDSIDEQIHTHELTLRLEKALTDMESLRLEKEQLSNTVTDANRIDAIEDGLRIAMTTISDLTHEVATIRDQTIPMIVSRRVYLAVTDTTPASCHGNRLISGRSHCFAEEFNSDFLAKDGRRARLACRRERKAQRTACRRPKAI